MENRRTDSAADPTEDLWPRFTANVDRARSLSQTTRHVESHPLSVIDDLSTGLEQLTQKVADMQSQLDTKLDPEQLQHTQDNLNKELRRQRLQIRRLEVTRAEAGVKTDSLRKHLELCFEAIRTQDERLSEQHAVLQAQIADLLERSDRHERDMIDLRSSQNARAERMEIASAELLELAHSTRVIAEQALDNAAHASEASERLEVEVRESDEKLRVASEELARELRDADDEVRVLVENVSSVAEMAKSAADSSALSIGDVRAELERELREVERIVLEATERLEGEVRESTAHASEATERLGAEVRESDEELRVASEELARELRDADDEVRVLVETASSVAEVARSAADSSALSIGGVRAELERELREVERIVLEATERLGAEVRESDEELRGMVEKAQDLAAFSSDTVAGLEADLEEQLAAVWEKLEKVATKEELDEIEGQIQADIHRTAEQIELAQRQLRESQDRDDGRGDQDRATLAQLDASASALRREVAREFASLRRLLDGGGEGTDTPAPKQRFRYYLPETEAPVVERRELTAVIEEATTVDEE